ncbi:type I restriction endonuclease subunit R [Candidatus Pseudothioglobus singularis]|nr:type I restriction endonuclease subunit R [Candidatus Pseudothioglobus singularis]
MSFDYNEDNLVEQATVDILASIGWKIETAWHKETFGLEGLLGRVNKDEVILRRYLLEALEKLNPDLPSSAYKDAYLKIAQKETSKSIGRVNKEKYQLLKDGVKVSFTNAKGQPEKKTLKVFDFNNPSNNHFLAVRQLEVLGELYSRRPDVVGFVNGIPLVFFEVKAHHRDLRHAYEDNFKDYKDTIPDLFSANALVILSNGLDKSDDSGTRVGTVTSPYKFFHEWKRIDENEKGVVSLDTTIRGTCSKDNLIDLFENFLLFDDSGGDVVKIMAKNHQFIGTNKAINSANSLEDLKGKLGVFWHTQGSGKSYSMVFLSQKIHRKFEGSFTILVVVDRSELESQIYDTFTAVGAVNEKNVLAKSREDLRDLLKQNHRYIFTLIHKFSIDSKIETEYPLLSERRDIIVLSDEAHRTQGGIFARNMRFNALPNASYFGFTGTPLIDGEDEMTKNIFGEYVSVYDFKSSIDDGATLPLIYSNKGEKLELDNPELDDEMLDIIDDEDLDEDQRKKLERAFKSNYPVLTSEVRLRAIAKDIAWNFNERGYQGKAMLVAMDKPTAVRMYDYISEYWKEYLLELDDQIQTMSDEQLVLSLKAKYRRADETEICVVVSSEQNEVDKFKKLDLDIKTHRKKFVERDLEKEFKDEDNPFRLAIVCAMWITGFDVPCLSTIYLDKPIKGHTLMQTIARANRVYDDNKEKGFIVDYGNVYKQLEEAYSIYGEGQSGSSESGDKPTKSIEELGQELRDSIEETTQYLSDLNFDLSDLFEAEPLQRLALISEAINAICLNETTRAKFEVMARDVSRKYNALYPEPEVREFTRAHNAIDAIYGGLNQSVKEADITDVIKKLQELVGESISIAPDPDKEDVYVDLSNLDFDKLKKMFEKNKLNKAVFDLQKAIDTKLKIMMSQNPLRLEFYNKYQKIIEEYNDGKDLEAIRRAFEDLVKFVNEMSEEEHRAAKENLDEETLAIYDLLRKDSLTIKEQEKVKHLSRETLAKLKEGQLTVQRWRESAQISAQIITTIHDQLLYLPEESYPDDEVRLKTNEVYQHIYSNYYGGGQSAYSNDASST